MNRISAVSVRPYINMKEDSGAPVTTEKSPVSFKGALGDTLLKEVSTHQTVPTVDTILSKLKSTFGLSSDKTKDVLESFGALVKKLISEKAALEGDLTLERNRSQSKVTTLNKVIENRDIQIEGLQQQISEKNETIREKNARIAELEKYSKLVEVKPVEEMGLVMPETILSTLEELEAHDEEAQKSLLKYVMTGKGQEAFLAQIERNNVILKSYKDGTDRVPEVHSALEGVRAQDCIYTYDTWTTAARMLENILSLDKRGTLLNSPEIYKQVRENVHTLIKALPDCDRAGYCGRIDQALKNAMEFQANVQYGTQQLLKHGLASSKDMTYHSETIDGVSRLKSYRTFVKNDGNLVDISLANLNCGWYGIVRERTPEGVVIRNMDNNLPNVLPAK